MTTMKHQLTRIKSSLIPVCLGVVILATGSGCDSGKPETANQAQPRPVRVEELQAGSLRPVRWVAATVDSWKDQQIGFEVAGRVKRVAEINDMIRGRSFDVQGDVIVRGTPIAELDDERFRLKVEQAKSSVDKALQDIERATIELKETLPARLAAARTRLQVAKNENARLTKLRQQNAIAKSEAESASSSLSAAQAEVKQIEASVVAQQSTIEGLKIAAKQARQRLSEAERDLKDCVLFSDFDGEITNVSVVPGSLVNTGQAVATIRMMDPIQVSVEVASVDSRSIRPEQKMIVRVDLPGGESRDLDAIVYSVDRVADSRTRTYSIKLLMINKRVKDGEDEVIDASIARTRRWWTLRLPFLPNAKKGSLYADQSAICSDDQGEYLWKIENATVKSGLPSDNTFDVTKLRIKTLPATVNYLGIYRFQEVEILPGQEFQPELNAVVGSLEFAEGQESHDDIKKVLMTDDGDWILRPGDLVNVDLNSNERRPTELNPDETSFAVPMSAIVRKSGQPYLMMIDDSTAKGAEQFDGEKGIATVRQRSVTLVSPVDNASASTIQQVQFSDGDTVTSGWYVNSGAHYLSDGETVRVIQ